MAEYRFGKLKETLDEKIQKGIDDELSELKEQEEALKALEKEIREISKSDLTEEQIQKLKNTLRLEVKEEFQSKEAYLEQREEELEIFQKQLEKDDEELSNLQSRLKEKEEQLKKDRQDLKQRVLKPNKHQRRILNYGNRFRDTISGVDRTWLQMLEEKDLKELAMELKAGKDDLDDTLTQVREVYNEKYRR